MPVSPQNVDTGWKNHPFSVRSLLPNPYLSTAPTQNVNMWAADGSWLPLSRRLYGRRFEQGISSTPTSSRVGRSRPPWRSMTADRIGRKPVGVALVDRQSTRLNSSHVASSYAVF